MKALTKREKQALVFYAHHGTRKAVAAELGISAKTVAIHLSHAYAKLNVESAISAFRAMGWLKPPEVWT